ncbi:hypothetical protein DXG03_003745 [Asterophora parasitica]|uniref:Uncharacterized protein n=1 Tax=Asterophora parasitica TaxID=117018 RepID=A0A9P7G0V7_9AGAR|nr:hypothetical protein DXG03_003745 [Asterophora parasitica]
MDVIYTLTSFSALPGSASPRTLFLRLCLRAPLVVAFVLCGEPNMYHQAFKCKVTGATATGPVASPKPAVWCEDDPSKCTKGAKQMIYWNQLDGNNIKVSGLDRAGMPKSPAYNSKLGFPDAPAPSTGHGKGSCSARRRKRPAAKRAAGATKHRRRLTAKAF